MKKSSVIIIVVVFVVISLIAFGVVYLRQYIPKHNWFVTLNPKSEEPYGTKLLLSLLEKSYEEENFKIINKNISTEITDSVKNSLLFFIGHYTYYDSLTIEWFKKYMNNGNSIFIASNIIPEQILSKIFSLDTLHLNTTVHIDSIVEPWFISDSTKKFSFHYHFFKDTVPYRWSYISHNNFDTYWQKSTFKQRAFIDSSRVNFIELEYGAGSMYLYTTPELLTNFYLSTPEGYEYANLLFNVTGNPEKFYWDNISQFPVRMPGYSMETKNPLEFILSKKELRWSWYMAILGIILFFVFRLKRQQNPVPILSSDKNTSVEYAKAVGQLHYKTTTHQNLADQLMKLFDNFVKERYGINIKENKEVKIEKVAKHSGIEKKLIKEIYNSHIRIKYNPDPDTQQTIKLYNHLDHFYKNCK